MCQSGDRKIELVCGCVGGEEVREIKKKNKVAFGKNKYVTVKLKKEKKQVFTFLNSFSL